MDTIWPYISFILGAFVSLLAQWISYRLSFKKDQKREYWIRKLNSYQDFFQHTNHIIGLLRNGISIPDNVFWQSVSLVRKAAFDAEFYDWANPNRPKEMQDITDLLIKAYQTNNKRSEDFDIIGKKIEAIQLQFYEDERSSWERSRLKAPNKANALGR